MKAGIAGKVRRWEIKVRSLGFFSLILTVGKANIKDSSGTNPFISKGFENTGHILLLVLAACLNLSFIITVQLKVPIIDNV